MATNILTIYMLQDRVHGVYRRMVLNNSVNYSHIKIIRKASITWTIRIQFIVGTRLL